MKKATVAAVEKRFAEFISACNKEPIVVMNNGKPIAMIVGVHDRDELERLVFASSRRLHEILEAGRKEIREGRGIPRDQFWKEVEDERPLRKKTIKKKAAKATAGK